jgi:hypothetical protein
MSSKAKSISWNRSFKKFWFAKNVNSVILLLWSYEAVLWFRKVYPGFRIPIFSIPDPGSASKNLSILTPKNCFWALRHIIWVVHPVFGSWVFTHPGSRVPDPDLGAKKASDPGSWIRIRNTDMKLNEWEKMSKSWVSPPHAVNLLQFSL